MNKNYIAVAKCTKPHGVRGAFSFELYNDDSVLKSVKKILLKPYSPKSSVDKQGKAFEIEKIKIGNKAIVFLKEVVDRNVVEEMIPFEVFVRREDFPKSSPGEYLVDYIGLEAVDSKTNEIVGKIESLYDNGAQTIIKIVKESGEILEIPLIDQFVKEPDFDLQKISILVPEYL